MLGGGRRAEIAAEIEAREPAEIGGIKQFGHLAIQADEIEG